VGHDRIRQAIYRELYRAHLLQQTNLNIAQARTAWEAGDRKAFTSSLQAAFEVRHRHFGVVAGPTQEIQTIHQRATGRVFAMEDGLPGPKVVEQNPAASNAAATAVAEAPRFWRAGNPNGGLRKAKQAYEIRRKLLGADHLYTRATGLMIEHAARDLSGIRSGG